MTQTKTQAAQMPTVTRAVLDELDEQIRAWTPVINRDSDIETIKWQAGGHAALLNLKTRLESMG